MARVAGRALDPAAVGDLYRRGVQQFEANLGRLLAKIPGRRGARLHRHAREQRARPGTARGAGRRRERSRRCREDRVLRRTGRRTTAGNYDAAREGYAWARDLDPLRFRAPSEFKRGRSTRGGATVPRWWTCTQPSCAASPNGLVGRRCCSSTCIRISTATSCLPMRSAALVANGLPGSRGRSHDAEARAGMPVSEVDRYLGDYKVLRSRPAGRSRRPLPGRRCRPGSEAERLAQELYHERITWPEAHGSRCAVTTSAAGRSCAATRTSRRSSPTPSRSPARCSSRRRRR